MITVILSLASIAAASYPYAYNYQNPIVLREFGPFNLPDTAVQMRQRTAFMRTQKENSRDMSLWMTDKGMATGCTPATCWMCPGKHVEGECGSSAEAEHPEVEHPEPEEGAGMGMGGGMMGPGMGMGGGMAGGAPPSGMQAMQRYALMDWMRDPDAEPEVPFAFMAGGMPGWAQGGPGMSGNAYNPMSAFMMFSQLKGTGLVNTGDGHFYFDHMQEPVLARPHSAPRTYIQPVVYPNGAVAYYPITPVNGRLQRRN